MKIKQPVVREVKQPKVETQQQVATEETAPPKSDTTFSAAEAKERNTPAARKALESIATNVATDAMADGDNHPLVEKFGESVGLTLGVIVTEALSLLPKWNKPIVDDGGKQVQSIPGAERIGDHALRQRHQEVVGPRIAKWVEGLHPGLVHDLLEGVAKGATDAPGTSYRLEVSLSNLFY